MIYPDYENFKKIKEKYEKITIYKEVFADTFTPISFLMNYATEDYIFLLESVNIDKTFSRFSFFGIKPAKIIYGVGNEVIIEENANIIKRNQNIIDYILKNYPEKTQYLNKNFGDFAGGLVGYFGFEAVNFMNILRTPVKISNTLHSVLFEVNKFFVFDNFKNKLYAAVCMDLSSGNIFEKYNKDPKLLNSMAEDVFNINGFSDDKYETDYFEIVQEYEKNTFSEKIKNIKEEINNGEAIQVVFSQKYIVKNKINPISFYRALRNINPSPYMFYLKFNDFVIAGSSPETHLKVKNNRAILKPIAGTYPIGENIEQIKNALLNDKKENAEHLMLLDLARNDLYQGCKVDTVKVEKSFTTEVYSHVIHIVSEVTGELYDNVTSFNLFLKTFPAGTVSGAPKVRAIELINDYEDSERGFYAGCIGYFGYNHNIDTCITIRSAFIDDNQVIFRAGAGIVADSIPENEYIEINRKLKAMFDALKIIKELR